MIFERFREVSKRSPRGFREVSERSPRGFRELVLSISQINASMISTQITTECMFQPIFQVQLLQHLSLQNALSIKVESVFFHIKIHALTLSYLIVNKLQHAFFLKLASHKNVARFVVQMSRCSVSLFLSVFRCHSYTAMVLSKLSPAFSST